jgi:hypothetical protein
MEAGGYAGTFVTTFKATWYPKSEGKIEIQWNL